MSRSMLNVECGAFHGVKGSAAADVAAASGASGVSGPWLDEAKLETESPGTEETWLSLMLSMVRGLPIDAVVCICVREGVPRALPT